MTHQYIDLMGKRFGKLTVIDQAETVLVDDTWLSQSLCECICGVRRWIRSDALLRGVAEDCGREAEHYRLVHVRRFNYIGSRLDKMLIFVALKQCAKRERQSRAQALRQDLRDTSVISETELARLARIRQRDEFQSLKRWQHEPKIMTYIMYAAPYHEHNDKDPGIKI